VITARFDDLTPGAERSFALEEPVGVIEARRAGEVRGVLSSAESAAERGLWVAGFVAYEASPGLNPSLEVRVRDAVDPFAELPVAWFGLFERRREIPPLEPVSEDHVGGETPWRSTTDRPTYDAAIARIRDLIAAGQTYQVNHTIRLRATIEGDERGLYRDLALAQRGAFSVYLNLGRYRVLSASPELFFRLDGDRVTTRPMKGTARRGRWLAEDEAAAAALVASEKDRAENAMIVDLLRNDLGRIARPGSVETTSMFDAERYETVWQLTSTITADLDPATPVTDVFATLFPSGSVTGAPKVATAQVISALEDSPRGVYCGAIGLLAPPGSSEARATFNVAIRTVVLDGDSHVAEYGVGGGITYDSSAAGEYDEALAKARVLSAARPSFALFETLRHDTDGFRHLDLHLERLTASARYFGFRLDAEDALAALKAAAADATGPVRVRLTLERGGAVTAEASPLPPASDGPVRLAIDEEPVDPSDVFLFHKTTRRDGYGRRIARHPGVEDVLLVNPFGQVTESTIANVAVRLDGVWWTPPIASGLLPGTGREAALRDGRLHERPVTVDELRAAEGVALVSSVRGWRDAEVAT
jgi:para-aminobenzoate synthetase / 4-amino-4-deoxychorismate lyase